MRIDVQNAFVFFTEFIKKSETRSKTVNVAIPVNRFFGKPTRKKSVNL
jgi:hypothetical protein